MHPPPVILKNVFNVYNFFISSNLSDSNQPYAIIENVRTKCIIFGEALRIRIKKFKLNLPEGYSQ